MAMVTLYSKNNCMQCKMTKRFLQEHAIEFTEINISEQPEYIEALRAEGFMATPVVKVNGSDAFSGFRPDQLNKLTVSASI